MGLNSDYFYSPLHCNCGAALALVWSHKSAFASRGQNHEVIYGFFLLLRCFMPWATFHGTNSAA